MAKRKIDWDTLAEYLKSHTVDETSERFKTARSYLYSIIKKRGLKYIRRRDSFPTDIEQFKDYVRSHTSKESVEHFKLKKGTFSVWCRRLGLKPLRKRKCPFLYTKEFWEQNKGAKVKEISEKYGASIATVFLARKRFKDEIDFKSFRRPRRKNAERDEMISFLAEKYSLTSIAAAFNMSRERVRQIVEREEKTK